MDEFTLNSTTTGDQDQPSVAGLRGTQFVAVWRNASTQDIRGRLFGVNGNPSSPEFNIALPQATGTKRQLPTVIEVSFGFAVEWIKQLPGGVPQLKVRSFDWDTLSGKETQASSAEVEPLVRPAMARLADGGFVVVWADKRKDERIRAQRYGIDTMKRGGGFGRQHDTGAASLADGGGPAERKLRDRVAPALGRAAPRALPDLQSERRAGGPRAGERTDAPQ